MGSEMCIRDRRYFLNQFDYPEKDHQVVFEPDPRIVQRGKDAVGD